MHRHLLVFGIALAAFVPSALGQPRLVQRQSIGRTNSLRTFEQNGARHVAVDDSGRVHVVFADGEDLWYRRGAAAPDGAVVFEAAERVNDDDTRVLVFDHVGLPATRGAALALGTGPAGVVVHVAWTGDGRDVMYRRLEEGGAGFTWGPITDTEMDALMPAVATDRSGAVHVVAEHAYVEAGDRSEIRFASSVDGTSWEAGVVERSDETGSWNYRLPCVAVDLDDRLHVVIQAEGYRGDGGGAGATWWAARHLVREPDGGPWTPRDGPLDGFGEWGPPPAGRAILFAYCNLAVDGQGDLHMAWHGTARSGAFALDDVYHARADYDAGSGTFGPWSTPEPLHRRIHDDAPGGPIDPGGGDDELLTWVPSLATDAAGDLYAVIMFGAFDDEIGPESTSAATEAGLLYHMEGGWQPELINLSESPGDRNWYPNAADRPRSTASGERFLDVLWVEGVHDPGDPWARNYEVVHAVLALEVSEAPEDGGPGDGGPSDGGPSDAGPSDGSPADGAVDSGPGDGSTGCGGCAASACPPGSTPLVVIALALARRRRWGRARGQRS